MSDGESYEGDERFCSFDCFDIAQVRIWSKGYIWSKGRGDGVKRCPDCGAVAGQLDPIMHGSQCGWDDEIRQDR
jgi:hypothetical protein